ncbi:subtilisin-like serine protease [Tulasnella sp. 332]|nr:subtilisin-like serine protease [Tulasnella sp. 332]
MLVKFFNGFAFVNVSASGLHTLSARQDIEYIWDEQVGRIAGVDRTSDSYDQQDFAPRNLARLSSPEEIVPWPHVYSYPQSAGQEVTIYVLDSGIDIDHPEFEGRAEFGYDAIRTGSADGTDLLGHGTAVASIAAGATYGVAKRSRIINVKVAKDNGDMPPSAVIAGLNYVFVHQRHGRKQARRMQPAVINLSIDSLPDVPLEEAVRTVIRSGVHVIVSGGNHNEDAIHNGLAHIPGVITVGALDDDDEKTNVSNTGGPTGESVTFWAPGLAIPVAAPNGQETRRSGTSFAAPHVAGIAALYLSEYGDMKSGALVEMITRNSIQVNGFRVPQVPARPTNVQP